MSRAKSKIDQNDEFIDRFIELCGTDKPTEISQKFDVSYQAAKNYLAGRIPETGVLIHISSNTSYSLHWLLTGFGPKFALSESTGDSLSPGMISLIRDECEKNVAELLGKKANLKKEKVLVLRAKDIKEEKVLEASNPISLNQT